MKKVFTLLTLTCLGILISSCGLGTKKITELPNGNFIVSSFDKDYAMNLYGIQNADGEFIIEPRYTDIAPLAPDYSLISGKNNYQPPIEVDVFTPDGQQLFDNWESIANCDYNSENQTFILRSWDNFNTWHIADREENFYYYSMSCSDITFAKGLKDAYLEKSYSTPHVYKTINKNGEPYSRDNYYIMGMCAIDLMNGSVINLVTGEKHAFKDQIDDTYLEVEDGIINVMTNTKVVSYSDTTVTNATMPWLAKKDVNKLELAKVIEDVAYYYPIVGGYVINILYKPTTDGQLRFSPYNLENLKNVLDYIRETEMHTVDGITGKESPIYISYNIESNWGGSMTFNSRTEGIQYCRVNDNGEWAVFVTNTDHYRFHFNTEKFGNVSYQQLYAQNTRGEIWRYGAEETGQSFTATVLKKEYRPWLHKTWYDGTYHLRFDLSNVYIFKNGTLINHVPYEYNPSLTSGSTCDMIYFEFVDSDDNSEYSNFVSLIIQEDGLYYEGGDGEGFEVVDCI